MPTVLTPYGLYATKAVGSRRYTNGVTHFPVEAEVAATIYYGAPVALISKGLAAIAASPTTTAGVTSPVGTFHGAWWEEKSGVKFSTFLPAGLIASGAKKVWAMVNDDPDLWFRVLANATLDNSAVGKCAALVNPGAGNTSTGRSTCALLASSVAVGATTAAVRIVRVLQPAEAYPEVLVQWNGGIHQYVNGFAA